MTASRRDILLITTLVVIVFLPTVTAELFQIDDREMYRWLVTSLHFDPIQVFFPREYHGGYYRPLVVLSYLWDKFVWGAYLPLMHLDNILFHLLNAFLVYLIIGELCRRRGIDISWLPLFASLTFGLHPVMTESVAWISGRTDILACFFVLLAMLFLLRSHAESRRRLLWYALAAAIVGVLAKETAIAVVIAAFLIVPVVRQTFSDSVTTKEDCIFYVIGAAVAAVLMLVLFSVKAAFIVAAASIVMDYVISKRRGRSEQVSVALLTSIVGTVIAVAGFWLIRTLVFKSSTSTLGQTISLLLGDMEYSSRVFLGATGFYLKKFFFPLPLNFSIADVDPLYQVLGVGLFFLFLYFIVRPSLAGRLFLAGFAFVLPALPLAFGTIAWTPYAERYIYIAVAFWTFALCLWSASILRNEKAVAMCFFLVIAAAGISFNRCIVWRTNVALCGDSVKKSPLFLPIRQDYMLALMETGNYAEAHRQYDIASKFPTIGYNPNLDLQRASLYMMEGKRDLAFELFEDVAFKSKLKSSLALDMLVSNLYEEVLIIEKTNKEVSDHLDRLDFFADKLCRLDYDIGQIYYLGKLMARYDRHDAAIRYFRLAERGHNGDAAYRELASKYLRVLKVDS